MRRVDYDEVASAYDGRYSHRYYEDTLALLQRFVVSPGVRAPSAGGSLAM